MPECPDPAFVDVAIVDARGRMKHLRILLDGVPIARKHGWMVFTDFENQPFTAPRIMNDATGFSGEDDAS